MSSKDEPRGFAAMLAEYDERDPAAKGRRPPRVGDKVSGSVVVVTNDAVFVDLGGKAEGVLDREELVDPDNGELTVAVGDRVEARVASMRDGTIVLRRRAGGGTGAEAGEEIAQARQLGIPVEGVVKAVNKGGVEVEVGKVRAFCPISQLDAHYVEDPAVFIGRKLAFRVTDYEAGRGAPNVVLSRRALLEQERAERAAVTRASLEVGAIIMGTVVATKTYGAFVDIGGLEGMLHVSELGYGRIEHPDEVLVVGQKIEVQVTKIERTDDPRRPERIGLSLKALQDDPWVEAVGAFPKGKMLRGPVVRLEPFGAFVAVADGIEGLIHVSEMVADRRVNHPREVVSMGQEVEVCVLDVDPEKHRLALSLTAVAAQQEAEQAASYQPVGQESLGTFADLMKHKLGK